MVRFKGIYLIVLLLLLFFCNNIFKFICNIYIGYAATVLLRQKKCRDRLGAALRENKKRLYRLEMEINVLKRPISTDLGERLDHDILQLRSKCQTLINEIENKRRGNLYLIFHIEK